MLKRLWLILGPVVTALGLLGLLLLFYPTQQHHDLLEEKKAAVTLTAESFKSRTQKVRALSDPDHDFVPFFGSSEWLRFDAMHPSVLAEKYNRSYTPFLLGQRGAASLTQYFGMQQIAPQLEENRAVYVLSPQWFTKKGYDQHAFQTYFSSDQLTAFLSQQDGDQASAYAAERLMELYPDVAMKGILEKIAAGKELTRLDQMQIEAMSRINVREDLFFSPWVAGPGRNFDQKVLAYGKELPDDFSYEALEELATEQAKEATSNNEFGIDKNFYNKRIAPKKAKLKGFQSHLSYVQSPEYNDLQLALTQFSKSKTRVLFVIPPVNAKWMEYTGLDQTKYNQAVEKIKYQLESQGFTDIADFSQEGDRPYFMQDTIHLGWNGWLAFDKAVYPFVESKEKAPSYQLNERFFSKDWAQYDGELEDFK